MFEVFSKDIVKDAISTALSEDVTKKFEEKLKASLAPFTEVEAKALVNIIESAMYHASDPVRDLVEVNLVSIIQLARAVKSQARAPFGGIIARGNELTATNVDAEMFEYVWGATGRTTFENTLTSVGTFDYIGTEASPQSVAEEEGYIILGFIDPVAEPVVHRAQLIKDRTEYQYVSLKFEYAKDYPLAALPEPWVILPEQSFHIKVKNKATGRTKLHPIAFKICRAKVLLSL